MDLYAARINVHGDNRIDRITNEQEMNFIRYLNRTPNRKTIYIDKVSYYASILLKKDEKNNTHLQLMTPFATPIKTGTLLEWNNAYWIVLYEVEPKKTSSFNGVIKKCNNTLKWIDKYGIERETPCYITGYAGADMQYQTSSNGFGANSSFLFSNLNANIDIIIQKNDFTSILENETRFILNKEAWILDNIDSLSSNDLIYIELKHVMKSNVNDDLENSLANKDTLNSWKLKIVNGEEISLYPGDSVPVEVLIYESDNIVHSPQKLIWTVDDESIVEIDGDIVKAISNGKTTLRVALADCADIYDELLIEVQESPELNISYSFDGDLTIKQGETKTYTVTKTINGKLDTDVEFRFSLEDIRKVTYGLKKISKNTITIEARSKGTTGVINLTAKDDFWSETKTISVESIFA